MLIHSFKAFSVKIVTSCGKIEFYIDIPRVVEGVKDLQIILDLQDECSRRFFSPWMAKRKNSGNLCAQWLTLIAF